MAGLRGRCGATLQAPGPPNLLTPHVTNARASAGFPDHPHRGFETCSIMLSGRMEHADSMRNKVGWRGWVGVGARGHDGEWEVTNVDCTQARAADCNAYRAALTRAPPPRQGVIGPGGVQWMTAGRGVVHSEMPVVERGKLLHGFQLWINLRAKDKMCKPRWGRAARPAWGAGHGSLRAWGVWPRAASLPTPRRAGRARQRGGWRSGRWQGAAAGKEQPALKPRRRQQTQPMPQQTQPIPPKTQPIPQQTQLSTCNP
jgi:hypothetical protein